MDLRGRTGSYMREVTGRLGRVNPLFSCIWAVRSPRVVTWCVANGIQKFELKITKKKKKNQN